MQIKRTLFSIFLKNPLFSFSVSIYTLLTLPRMLSYGMFFDGTLYAIISKNMANGTGSLWAPHISESFGSIFYEQPPMAFFIESFFFRLLGDSVYVESFFGFFVGFLTILMIKQIWEKTILNYKDLFWIPVLFFSIMPMTSWLYSNNMLEILMTFFTMVSIYFTIKAHDHNKTSGQLLWGLLSGTFIVFAFLTKGPVGLFPFALPFGYFLIKRTRETAVKMIYIYSGILLSFILFFCYLYLNEEAFRFLSQYFKQQVIASLEGKRENAARYHVFIKLFSELSLPLVICGILFFIYRQKAKIRTDKYFYLFLFISISASLPIAISTKQMRWYIFPSLPLYLIALSVLMAPYFSLLQKSLVSKPVRRKYIQIISFSLVFLSVFIMYIDRNSLRKSKDFHYDFSIQKLKIENNSLVSIWSPSLYQDYDLLMNLIRRHNIIIVREKRNEKYILVHKDDKNIQIPNQYKRYHPKNSAKYILYKKDEQFK